MNATQSHHDNAAMPDAEELAGLPRRARVALAARCARRSLSALVARWGDAFNEVDRAFGWIVAAVENEGAGIEPGRSLAQARSLALKAVDCAGRDAADPSMLHSAILAGQVADFCEVLVYGLRAAMEEDARRSATQTANAALKARQVIGVDDMPAFRAALVEIRGDFEKLNEASARLNWTAGTCVPPVWFSQGEHVVGTEAADGGQLE